MTISSRFPHPTPDVVLPSEMLPPPTADGDARPRGTDELPHESESGVTGGAEETFTAQEIAEGARRLAAVLRVRELRAQGMGWTEVGRAMAGCGMGWTWLYRLARRVEGREHLTARDLATRTGRRPALAASLSLSAAEAAAIRANLLVSNRTWDSGSVPAAIRRTMRDGGLRPETAERLRAREAAGKPYLTPAESRLMRISPAVTRHFRNSREAWLDLVENPGSLMLWTDPATGEERPIEAGEAWTLDDASINFVACVPTDDPRWPHKVMPGRFQLLVAVDHRSYFIPGFCYTARPRDSYRAEDLIATIDICAREHGVPRRMILEHGVSAAGALTRCLDLLGVQIERANSPHQKVVELVFNSLWTSLSFEPGQVGRYRGEEEKVSALITSCREGAKDPRRHFLPLADVLQAVRGAIADWNGHWVNGSRYGRWQPAELFAREAGKHLRQIAAEDRWVFAPFVSRPLRVARLGLQTSVQLAEGFSEQFSFAGEWLADWLGASVRLHWNPFAADEFAQVTLAETFAGARAGTLLGRVEMVDRHARWTRRAWGYSDAADAGQAPARRAAQALHRTGVAIRPDGKPGVMRVETRSGTGESRSAERGGRAETVDRTAIPAPAGRRSVTPECSSWDADPRLAAALELENA